MRGPTASTRDTVPDTVERGRHNERRVRENGKEIRNNKAGIDKPYGRQGVLSERQWCCKVYMKRVVKVRQAGDID